MLPWSDPNSQLLVDTCVITDLSDPESSWFDWAADKLEKLDDENHFCINPIIYAESSIAYATVEEVEDLHDVLDFTYKELPREALFLAGRAFLLYRRKKGTKFNVLPDFFIGAHAAVEGYPLLTRDTGRFGTYFPTVELIAP